jgi:hypothetical protein
MSTERIERIRADEVSVGDRIKAPEGRAFYELTVAEHKPGLDVDEDRVELGTGWGSVTLEPGEMVERENWQVGDAAAEVEGAKRGRLDDLRALLLVASGDGDQANEATVEALDIGAEYDDHELQNDGGDLEERATEAIDEYPLCVEATTMFEVVLGTGGPDDRLLFECSGGEGEWEWEIDRVLYRYSWTGSAERVLSGEDRETAEELARRVVPELTE